MENNYEENNKEEIVTLTISGIIYGIAIIYKFSFWVDFALYFISYILSGYDVILKAIKNIAKGRFFDENFLMSISTIGAFLIKQFPEAAAVMIFYKLGEFFQDMAVYHSRKSILDLMNVQQDDANLKLIKNAENKKAKTENFISKFAKMYTPIVVISALLLAVIPPLVLKDTTFSQWIYRALIFLMISCPCALVVSVPLAFLVGIGSASKKGILVKCSYYLEKLSDIDTLVFDKTGSSTNEESAVTKIHAENKFSKETIENLKHTGIKNIVMLTESDRNIAKNMNEKLNIVDVHLDNLFDDKAKKIEMIRNKISSGHIALVSDNVNDAIIFHMADLSIAMEGIGSVEVIGAADIVIMNDEIQKIGEGILIAQRTKKIICENIIFSIAIKAVLLIFGALGITSMWQAVFGDVGVAVIAILNSMRVMKEDLMFE